jgi:hypothetical protein
MIGLRAARVLAVVTHRSGRTRQAYVVADVVAVLAADVAAVLAADVVAVLVVVGRPPDATDLAG